MALTSTAEAVIGQAGRVGCQRCARRSAARTGFLISLAPSSIGRLCARRPARGSPRPPLQGWGRGVDRAKPGALRASVRGRPVAFTSLFRVKYADLGYVWRSGMLGRSRDCAGKSEPLTGLAERVDADKLVACEPWFDDPETRTAPCFQSPARPALSGLESGVLEVGARLGSARHGPPWTMRHGCARGSDANVLTVQGRGHAGPRRQGSRGRAERESRPAAGLCRTRAPPRGPLQAAAVRAGGGSSAEAARQQPWPGVPEPIRPWGGAAGRC